MSDARKWGHDELANDLAAHCRAGADRMVWTNMQLGPSGSPRPDVYTIQKSYSKPRPMAYEVKISVSDFRSDVTSGKWQSYLQYAGAVVFAVPAGLVTKDDVPRTCGLIVRHEQVWRSVKAPTIQHFHMPEEAWLKLLIDGLHRETTFIPEARSSNRWTLEARIREQHGEVVAAAVRDALAMRDRIELAAKTLEEYERRGRARIDAQLNGRREAEAALLTRLCKVLDIDPSVGALHTVWRAEQVIAKRIEALSVDKRLTDARDSLQTALQSVQAAIRQCTVGIVEQEDAA